MPGTLRKQMVTIGAGGDGVGRACRWGERRMAAKRNRTRTGRGRDWESRFEAGATGAATAEIGSARRSLERSTPRACGDDSSATSG
jgi:hypothetical protein